MNLSASSRNNLIKRTKTIKNACYILVVNTKKKKKRKWINLSTRGRQKVWASLLPVMPHRIQPHRRIQHLCRAGCPGTRELALSSEGPETPRGCFHFRIILCWLSRWTLRSSHRDPPPENHAAPRRFGRATHKLQRDRAGYTAGAGRLSSLLYHCQKALLSFGFFYFFF